MKKISTVVPWRGGDVIFGVVFLGISCAQLVAADGPHALAYSYSEDAPPPVPPVAATPPGVSTNAVDRSQMLYIKEFRVIGSHQLSRSEIEKSVYPFMGPERTPEDVEQARAALEKAFQDKGFQAVSVQIPQQTGKRGIVFLQVTEAKVGRLNVEGSRYFSIDAIKKKVPSLQPGTVPDFNKVSKEILALNQWSDRQVIPTLTPGFEPGTLDVNLKVNDTLPWHGSVELNNRYSYGTPELRLNLATSYDNLWQLGHSAGGSYQTAPEQPSAVKNWNLFYTALIPKVDWLKLNVSYSQQNSISTLGGGGSSLGNGNTAGFRFLCTLPAAKDFSQSFNWGIDFKHVNQITQLSQVSAGANVNEQPLDYWPVRLNYNGVWAPSNSVTILNTGLSFGFRGAAISIGNNSYGNENQIADAKFGADGGFIALDGDLSHTHDLPGGFQIFGKVQGQVSPEPLIFTEQFSGGGLNTCRGYLESTVIGDSGVFGTVEVRSPMLLPGHAGINEWRVYAFLDGGTVTNVAPSGSTTPVYAPSYNLASYGLGSRLKMFKYLNGSVDVGIPMTSQPAGQTPYTVVAWSPLVTFRLFGEF
ncbi:MAG: ShlB/FhaC/HecB family hemolysin secretion/activation protein [Verrucomicrobiota bacterium]